jgi:hypothetical protein
MEQKTEKRASGKPEARFARRRKEWEKNPKGSFPGARAGAGG